MRLKKLEIKGFKSFANETVVNFNEDVIGIVGPNGSGKSNIVDAIRWVLGEQKSKELRLDQMSSIIFNGTKKKKPAGIASVSLTFENTKNILPTEFQSVTITRMLYRTGESEYRLNGVICRLKDITSLFLDTGIGSNSYAIIALGMVDDILNDKDDSRRRMFEQAAGVSKYKIRKRETIAKLESTSEDLNRVEDLLFEINNNLEVLEKQAKRARKYFEIKDQYKVFSIQLAVGKMKVFKVQQLELNQKLEKEEDRYRQCEIATRKLEAQLENERKKIIDDEKALSEKQRELNRLVGNIRGQENDKKMLEQKIQFVQQNKGKLESSIQESKNRCVQLEEDIEFYQSSLNYEKHREEKLEDDLDKAQGELDRIKTSHQDLKANLDSVMSDQRSVEKEVLELEKQKAINHNNLEVHRNNLGQHQKEISGRSDEIESLRNQGKDFATKETSLLALLEKLENQERERLESVESFEEDKKAWEFKKNKITRELDAKRNEYQLTKSLVENMEGFPESIRFLKNTKEWKENAQLLTDLAYVPDQYRSAIENFLEPYLNYYVVQDYTSALQAISLLNKSQKGKANFFVLSAFDGYVPRLTAVDIPGAIRAVEQLQVDALYQPLFDYLLDGVYIVKSDQQQAEISAEGLVLLAEDGSFIKRKGAVGGGSVGLFEGNKIGRKKTLEILTNAIQQKESEEKEVNEKLKSIENAIAGLKAEGFQSQIQQTKNEVNQLAKEKVTVDTKMENFEQFVQQIQAKIGEAQHKIEELEAQNRKIENQLSQMQVKVLEAKSAILDTDYAFRDVAEKLSQASARFNEVNIEFIKQQNKVSSIQRDLTYREKELSDTKAKLKENELTFANSDAEIQSLDAEIKGLDKELETGYSLRKTLEGQLTDAEQKYFDARGKVNEIEDDLRAQQKVRTDAQVLINTLKEKSSDIKFEITSIAQRLRIEFEVEINDHINQVGPEPELGQEELQLRVERLKSRLDNYGEINPMAVQAYDEMKERHDTISKQRDDIVQAKESLLQTIKEIEETATAQFLESFDQARLYFINVFRSLFTSDDSCDLILLTPENPLESKIEIVAKPKGKRPQSISQLSGGEKTLTATALLFALYLLKPAPFCIFDEVDAPLDDANISKFNNIIKKFSKESQFIIVTHNKLTMAAVDTIYGVYMPEQGVSAVSQVDFRSFEHSGTFEVVN